MKLNDLRRHLRDEGCLPKREGGRHTIWENPANGKTAPVFRHNEEVGAGYVGDVCKQLGVIRPAGR